MGLQQPDTTGQGGDEMAGDSWRARLERDGFVHIPRVLPMEDVSALALLSLRSVDDYSESEDLIRTAGGVPLKLTYPLDKYPEFLTVLGRKEISDIVDRILPRTDSVLTWEDVLIKMPLVGEGVGAHQDIGLDPTRETIFSLGISLHDDSDNPVYFLPGSHRLGPLTTDAVTAIRRDCKPEFVPVVSQPGDVVIHNVHVLHYSEPNSSKRPRATWYLEFRSMASLLERGPWSADWTHHRRAIWVHARKAAGDDGGETERDEVMEYLAGLQTGHSSLRVPHVTEEVRYDPTSPYNHFSNLSDDWKTSGISTDATHHIDSESGRPMYTARFSGVEKFHEPGLAPVRDASGAYHVTPDGVAAYDQRHLRTFGFYEGFAAVHSRDGWFHIRPDGSAVYEERYSWCGNFQEGRCAVRLPDDCYLHITRDGPPAYAERYRYVGDFKDGYAVVQRQDGRHTHIDNQGTLLHGRWFDDLDVYHKSHARARDSAGWHHVDMAGRPLYEERFNNVEPFYNGQARVEGFDGSLLVIDESGQTVAELRRPSRSQVERLSGDMVGLWRTQTIHAAVELGVFECLPTSATEVARRTGTHESAAPRLMRALVELGLARRDAAGMYHATERGALLAASHSLSLANAARHWGRESYQAWAGVSQSLRTGRSAFENRYGKSFFDWIQDRPSDLTVYHSAMSTYARHDYRDLATAVDFSSHDKVLDAGGGTGELAFALLRSCPGLEATVMDRAEVVRAAAAPADLEGRCRFVAGDLFGQWPVTVDAVILARVLHDWPDRDAVRILSRAREAMRSDGMLYLVEMVLDDATGDGGLLDLNMLVMTQGAERTEEQFGGILGQAGFRLMDVTETGAVSSVIRAKAV